MHAEKFFFLKKTKISYLLLHTLTCVYQGGGGGGDISFAYVRYEWSFHGKWKSWLHRISSWKVIKIDEKVWWQSFRVNQ